MAVFQDHESLIITRKNDENLVPISIEEYDLRHRKCVAAAQLCWGRLCKNLARPCKHKTTGYENFLITGGGQNSLKHPVLNVPIGILPLLPAKMPCQNRWGAENGTAGCKTLRDFAESALIPPRFPGFGTP